MRLTSVAGAIYGATFFAVIVEAGTAPLGISFVVLVAHLRSCSRTATVEIPATSSCFFLVSSLVSLVLFSSWAIYWGGLPQFSEVGLIK